jgi:hypothetical protein
MDFSDAMIAGIPLALLVLGAVEFVKAMGLKGRVLLIASLVIGTVFGVLYRMSIAMPVTFVDWLGAAVYGVALGLTATGVYEAMRSAAGNRIKG